MIARFLRWFSEDPVASVVTILALGLATWWLLEYA